MELILTLKDESKLAALLAALQNFTNAEGADLSVESLKRDSMLESPNGSTQAELDEIITRDKLRPGQPTMTEEEEVEFINQAVKETRAAMRTQQNA